MDLANELPTLVTDLEIEQHKSVGFQKICLITLGGDLFGIDFHLVQEVFRVESITPVPGTPASLVGVANLRGAIILLADIRSFLGVSTATLLLYAIVVRYGPHQVAILVDDVPEIRILSSDDISPLSTHETSAGRPFVSGLMKIDGRTGGIVNLTTVLTSIEESLAEKKTQADT